MAKGKKRVKRVPGDFLAIPLHEGSYGFARVLTEPLVAFYDATSDSPALPAAIASSPILFKIFVMNSAITKGDWTVIGTARRSYRHPQGCDNRALLSRR